MSINTPEPPPVPTTGIACWNKAIFDWGKEFSPWPPAVDPETHSKILAAFRERDQMGEAKYGTRLRPHDGRNSLVDAAQELMDALVYLTKHQMEGGECAAELAALRRLLFTLFQRLETA